MKMAEQKAFSERLLLALKNNDHSDSPTRLCRSFNLSSGSRPLTVHAVRKWMVGEAIPTQDKVRALCERYKSDWSKGSQS